MKWYRRIEIWIFLVAVVGVLAWVFTQRRPAGAESGESTSPGAAASAPAAPVTVLRCAVTRDYGNANLDLDVRVRNDSAEKLAMSAPKVRLLTEKGREIPSFFLAFADVPSVAPHATADVQLRYWVEAADLKGGLRLEVNGFATPVKGPKPFDLQAAKQGEKHVFKPTDW